MDIALLKSRVKKGTRVTFSYYRGSSLWYKTEDGFFFPVPIEDIGAATFLAEDESILFMRYIRKQMELK